MTRIRLTIDDDARRTRRVVESVLNIVPSAEVRDARRDADAEAFLDRLVCCGSITPVLEVGGLLLTAPNPAEAVLTIRRAAPELVA